VFPVELGRFAGFVIEADTPPSVLVVALASRLVNSPGTAGGLVRYRHEPNTNVLPNAPQFCTGICTGTAFDVRVTCAVAQIGRNAKSPCDNGISRTVP
jgi:hypothetical protein